MNASDVDRILTRITAMSLWTTSILIAYFTTNQAHRVLCLVFAFFVIGAELVESVGRRRRQNRSQR